LDIDYKNNNEEVSKRQVEPIGLVFYAFSWHLIAWCHIRNDYRDFKVSRILKLRNTEMAFRILDHIELDAYMKMLPVDY
jgi:predicted DNA-binding transcriptional regulator YafY